MRLIQLFLPLADNEGHRFARAMYDEVDQNFLEKFDGFTAYPRAPANGLWRSAEETVQQDEIIVYEVLVAEIDFQQDQLHLQALLADVL